MAEPSYLSARAAFAAVCCVAFALPASTGAQRQEPNKTHTDPQAADEAKFRSLVGKAAPAFSLPDTDGKQRALAAWKGRSLALFFFCGCDQCAQVAATWAPLQRSGALAAPAPRNSPTPLTVVVYQGTALETESLADHAGMDRNQTVLLTDPDRQVTTRYHADPCPRAAVVDPRGGLRHVVGLDGTPPALMVAQTLAALRAASQPSAKAKVPGPVAKRNPASSRRAKQHKGSRE